jgi:hypothetical protein
MSQIDLPRRHHLDAIASERWTASDQNRWTPQLRYARAASLESAIGHGGALHLEERVGHGGEAKASHAIRHGSA